MLVGRVTPDRIAIGTVPIRQVVGVGYQAHPLEELVHGVEIASKPHQLGKVLQTPLGLDGTVCPQFVEVALPLEGQL